MLWPSRLSELLLHMLPIERVSHDDSQAPLHGCLPQKADVLWWLLLVLCVPTLTSTIFQLTDDEEVKFVMNGKLKDEEYNAIFSFVYGSLTTTGLGDKAHALGILTRYGFLRMTRSSRRRRPSSHSR